MKDAMKLDENADSEEPSGQRSIIEGWNCRAVKGCAGENNNEVYKVLG